MKRPHTDRHALLCRGAIILSLFAMLYANTARAERITAQEEQVKAAFTVKFLGFVSFPNKSNLIRLCVIGQASIRDAFKSYHHRVVNRREILLTFVDSLSAALACDVIYLDRNKENAIPDSIQSFSALTVSDSPDFCKNGGMVELSTAEKTLVFDINLDQVRSNRLDVRANLLSLARHIILSK